MSMYLYNSAAHNSRQHDPYLHKDYLSGLYRVNGTSQVQWMMR